MVENVYGQKEKIAPGGATNTEQNYFAFFLHISFSLTHRRRYNNIYTIKFNVYTVSFQKNK